MFYHVLLSTDKKAIIKVLKKDQAELVKGYNLVFDTEAKLIQLKNSLKVPLTNIEKLQAITTKWQEMSLAFSGENMDMGITAAGQTKAVADAFVDVDYYLRINAPLEALTALTQIVRVDPFLSEARLTGLKTELETFMATL